MLYNPRLRDFLNFMNDRGSSFDGSAAKKKWCVRPRFLAELAYAECE